MGGRGRRKPIYRAASANGANNNNTFSAFNPPAVVKPVTVKNVSTENTGGTDNNDDNELKQVKLTNKQLQAEIEQLNSKYKGTLGVVNDRLDDFHRVFTRQHEEFRTALLDNFTRQYDVFTNEFQDLKKILLLDYEVPSSSATSTATSSKKSERGSISSNSNDNESTDESKSSQEMESTSMKDIEAALEKLHNGEPDSDDNDEEKVVKVKDVDGDGNGDDGFDILEKALCSVFETKYELVQQDSDPIRIVNDDQDIQDQDQEKETFVTPSSSPEQDSQSKMINLVDLDKVKDQDKDENKGKNDEKMEIDDENISITTSPVPVPTPIKKGTKRAFTMRIAVRKDDKDIIADYESDSGSSSKEGLKSSEESESDHEEIQQGTKKKVKLDLKPKSKRKPRAVANKSKSVPSVGLRRGRSQGSGSGSAKGRPAKSTTKTKAEPEQSTKSQQLLSAKSLKTEKKALNVQENKENNSTPKNEIVIDKNKNLILTLLNISPYISPSNDSSFTVAGKQLENMVKSIQKKEIFCQSQMIKKNNNITLINSSTLSKARGRPKSAPTVFKSSRAKKNPGETPRSQIFASRNTRQQRKLELNLLNSGDIQVITIDNDNEEDTEMHSHSEIESDAESSATTVVSTIRSSSSPKDFNNYENSEISREEVEGVQLQNNLYNDEENENESYLLRDDVFFGQNDIDDGKKNQNLNSSLVSAPAVDDNDEIQVSDNENENENEEIVNSSGLDLGDYDENRINDDVNYDIVDIADAN